MKSYWEVWRELPHRITHVKIILYEEDLIRMDNKQLELIQEGMRLIEQGMEGVARDPD